MHVKWKWLHVVFKFTRKQRQLFYYIGFETCIIAQRSQSYYKFSLFSISCHWVVVVQKFFSLDYIEINEIRFFGRVHYTILIFSKRNMPWSQLYISIAIQCCFQYYAVLYCQVMESWAVWKVSNCTLYSHYWRALL